MSLDDDASYKLLFSAPEVVRDLVLGFIPDEWLHSLDYSTLEKVPGSYVTDDLRHRADDVIWRVKAEGSWVYLYLLIEFQSRVDPWMAVRMMTYVGLLYQDLIRRGEVLPDRKLPPVLPIVLYNGDAKWTAATDIAQLIPKAPGLVAKYLPKLEYLLIDENQYGEADLAGLKNLVAAIIRFEHPENEQALLKLIDLVNEWLEGNPELRRTFAIWIRAVLLRQSKNTLALPKVRDLKELKMTLADRFDQWAQQHEQKGMQAGMQAGLQAGMQKGIEQGIEKGIEKGEALVLQKLLIKRFGPLPADLSAQIGAATAAQIDVWVDRVLDAQNLDEVFRP
ncbi:Rpn family recombination-promoting nuclease/putative transposase [Stutzerimonas kunmingensis]|uniref:Rpn family recombination-promoting nuclease/putative transposase n=1 Tax=Stutzerimonas kunmingensis TaxID=1211807 RepID=UPI00241C2E82|nr:Rpn family recombination-promoting nuclease/putative transposase [Stutzerimonas kunmingensis]